MAEENTTDSTQTNPTPEPNQAPASPDTSTTDPKPQSEPDPAPTVLTPAEEPGAEPAKEQTDEEKARATLFGAPEGNYEISGLAEGVTVDAAALEAVAPVAKELGLSNEGLSKIAGVYAEKVLPGVTQQVVDGIQRDVAATHAQWATEAQEAIKTDPVFEQHRDLKQVQQIAAKALDRLFPEEFRGFLQETGIGNHPEMVKAMYLVGTKISEDTSFERGSQAPAPKSRTDKYYSPQT